jgi:hypothetical protein
VRIALELVGFSGRLHEAVPTSIQGMRRAEFFHSLRGLYFDLIVGIVNLAEGFLIEDNGAVHAIGRRHVRRFGHVELTAFDLCCAALEIARELVLEAHSRIE